MDTQLSSPAFELKYKIFFFNLVMLFFIMLVVTFLALETEKSAFQDQTKIKGQTLLKSLEGILFELMIERDKTALDAIARKITSNEIPDNDIISAKLYDAQMSELASSEQASPMTGEASITTPSTLVISRPIKLPGNQEVGGIVQLYFSTAPLDVRLGAIIRKNLLLTIILSLLNFFSAIVLANIIIRPVQSLVEAADKVSQGDLGMKILEGGRDELGTLVTSFNRMVDSLRGHLEEIRTENRKLDRRVFELSTLHQATRMINSVLNLDRLFELIVDTTIQVLGGVKRCSIMLVDPRKNEFLIQNAKGLDVGLLPTSRRVPITQGIAGKVFATGESILINDLSNTETQILENAQVVRSSICVPVKCNEEVIGIISASNKISGDPFTNNDLNLLETLASQAGIAIKNARLYQDLDRKIFELATLHEVGKSLSGRCH